MNEKIIIYEHPLSDKEHLRHSLERKILMMPVRYNLIDILKELKHGRPMDGQDWIEKAIKWLEDEPQCAVPYSEFFVNEVFTGGDIE